MNLRRLHTIGAVILLAVVGTVAAGAHAQDSPRQRLASIFARNAHGLLSAPFPSVASLEMAVFLLQQAVELDPTDVELRRSLLQAARLAEDKELEKQVTADLVQLAPRDSSIRLARMNHALEKYQSAEDLRERYERLLTPENLRRLEPSVASRLAHDYAVLNRRMGHTDTYAEWLARSAAIDQTNARAAGEVAGFFMVREDDPFAEAELLLNLLVANPIDITTQAVLARHLLEHGGYEGAATMYRMAIDSHQPLGRLAAHDLIADAALAEWGARRIDRAIDMIQVRMRLLNRMRQLQAQQEDPELTPIERSEIRAEVPPTMHAILIAMLERRGEPNLAEQVDAFGATLQKMYDAVNSGQPGEGQEEPEQMAEARQRQRIEILLTEAWIRLWFTDSVDRARSLLEQAGAVNPLTETAMIRFDGWIAYRSGELDRAADLLEPIAEEDDAARLGLALVRIAQSDRQAAARHLLVLARKIPGTAIGIWSRDMLEEMLDRSVPATDLAVDLDGLIETIPAVLLDLGSSPTRLVSHKITPLGARFGPYEPVPVQLEVSNNTAFPLGISPDGPIKPTVVIQPRVTIAGEPGIQQTQSVVIELDRRLRLEPFSKLQITFDLRRTTAGNVLDAAILHGATVDLEAIINPRVNSQGAFVPGILGNSRRTDYFRIDGARVTTTWVENTREAIETPDDPYDTVLMSLLANAIHQHMETASDPALRDALEQARTTLAEAYPTLDPIAQAWVLASIPADADTLEPIRQHARSSDQTIVHLAYLVTQTTDEEDPMMLAAARSDDPELQRAGELFIRMREAREKMNATQGGPSSSSGE